VWVGSALGAWGVAMRCIHYSVDFGVWSANIYARRWGSVGQLGAGWARTRDAVRSPSAGRLAQRWGGSWPEAVFPSCCIHGGRSVELFGCEWRLFGGVG